MRKSPVGERADIQARGYDENNKVQGAAVARRESLLRCSERNAQPVNASPRKQRVRIEVERSPKHRYFLLLLVWKSNVEEPPE